MPADSTPTAIDTAELRRAARELVATWPPLTEDQKDTVATILGGTRIRRPQRYSGGNDAA